MANCDVQIKDTKTYHVAFTQNGAHGNAIVLGSNQMAYCYTSNATYYPIGNIYPFTIQVTCDLKLEYDDRNHLIATVTNVRSNLSGVTSAYGRAFQAKLFGSISGYPVAAWRSFAMAVSLSPNFPGEWDGAWRKCLGQWYSAGANCVGNCGSFGVVPGGTLYTFNQDLNSGVFGAHYSRANGQTSNRLDPGPFVWDLGVVTGRGQQAYIFIQGMEGVTNNDISRNCDAQRFRQTGRSSALGFEVPFIVLCPPEIEDIEQTDDVCESNVDVCFNFKPSELGGLAGANIVVEVKYEGQSWSDAMSQTGWAVANQPTKVCLNNLIPERKIEWRAKYTVNDVWEASSEYTYGAETTLFVPSVKMVVPDITNVECTHIKQGKYIEHYKKETNYYGD